MLAPGLASLASLATPMDTVVKVDEDTAIPARPGRRENGKTGRQQL